MNDPSTRMSRRTWIVWVAAAAGVAATLGLGRWQLSRAAQKEALQASLEAQAARPAVAPGDLARDASQATDQLHRRITLTGTWRSGATVYLDNRPMNARPGLQVFTPLVLGQGPDAVLVQRGWIPRHAVDRTAIAPFRTDAGRVTISGRLAEWPSRRIALGEEPGGPIRQNLDLATLRRESGLELRPLVVIQEPDAGTAGDGLTREWARPTVDVHTHYGYAAQWFGLAGLIAGLTLWFQILKPRMRPARPTPPDTQHRDPAHHG